MYTSVLDHDWIKNFYISIGYPIVPSSNLYEDDQETIKMVLSDKIT